MELPQVGQSMLLGSRQAAVIPSTPFQTVHPDRFGTLRGLQIFESHWTSLNAHLAASQWAARVELGSQQSTKTPFSRSNNPIVTNSYDTFVPRESFGAGAEHDHSVAKGLQVVGSSRERLDVAFNQEGAQETTCEEERRWLAVHREEHLGEWVALDGERLVASGPRANDVYRTARQSGIKLPFVVYVNAEDQLPFAGW